MTFNSKRAIFSWIDGSTGLSVPFVVVCKWRVQKGEAWLAFSTFNLILNHITFKEKKMDKSLDQVIKENPRKFNRKRGQQNVRYFFDFSA